MRSEKTVRTELNTAWSRLQMWVGEYHGAEATAAKENFTKQELQNYKENTSMYAYLTADKVETLVRELQEIHVAKLTRKAQRLMKEFNAAQQEISDIIFDTGANAVYSWRSKNSETYIEARKIVVVRCR